MPVANGLSEFRFLVVCRSASMRQDDGSVNLLDVVDTLEVNPSDRTELAVVVSVVLRPEMKDRCLDLMAYSLDRKLQRQKLPGYVGTPLILPEGIGPQCLPYSIHVPIHEPGYYGFDLWDREGTFAPPATLLATYLFGAVDSKLNAR